MSAREEDIEMTVRRVENMHVFFSFFFATVDRIYLYAPEKEIGLSPYVDFMHRD